MTAQSCEVGDVEPYLPIRDSDSQFFSGLVGDKLVIDDGTASDSRQLRIIDLRTKRSVYTATVRELGEVTGKRFLKFSELSKIKGDLRNCRQAANWRKSGFAIGWIRPVTFDLQMMKKTSAGKVSCIALQ